MLNGLGGSEGDGQGLRTEVMVQLIGPTMQDEEFHEIIPGKCHLQPVRTLSLW